LSPFVWNSVPGVSVSSEYSMSSGEQYRQRAAQCLSLARTALDPGNKAALVEMARAWTRLAEQSRARDETRSNEIAAAQVGLQPAFRTRRAG
jgi:hypothetical protein